MKVMLAGHRRLPRREQFALRQFEIGKGPGITRGPNANDAVFALLVEAAKDERIQYQVNVFPSATPTYANAMQVNRGGMAAGLLSIPLR